MSSTDLDKEIASLIRERAKPNPIAMTRCDAVWAAINERMRVAGSSMHITKTAVTRALHRLGYQIHRDGRGSFVRGIELCVESRARGTKADD